MSDRDVELGRALGDLPVPEHGPDFWAELQRRIDADEDDDRAQPTSGNGPSPLGDDTDELGAVVRLPDRSRQRDTRLRRLVAAAAAVVVVAGGAAYVVGQDGDGDDVVTLTSGPTTEPTAPQALRTEDGQGFAPPSQPPASEPAAPFSAPAATPDPSAVQPAQPLGPGLVVGALPAADGSTTVLVRDVLGGDDRGCEGAPLEGLQVLGPDGSTRPVLSAQGDPIVDGVAVHPSPDGRQVAVATQCEGFLGQVLVGTVGSDGVPTDLQVVAGVDGDDSPVPGAPPVDAAPWVSWSADGERLLVTTATFGSGDGSTQRALWELDLATGSWTQRDDAPAGVVAAVERLDGSLVAVTEDELVTGSDVQPRRGVTGLVRSPDGVNVVAYGGEGAFLVDQTGAVGYLTGGSVTRARFLPDGSWLVLARYSDAAGAAEIASLPLTGTPGDPFTLGSSAWGWFEVLADGSGLLVSVDGPADDDGFPRPSVEGWAFATR